jgi:cytochrome c553
MRGRRAGTLLALVCLSAAVSPAPLRAAAEPTDPASMAAHVQPCTACHGARGHATNEGYYPRIAGKPAGYLLDQMRNFRDGRRHFPEMVYLMQLQDGAYLRAMAEYFAAQEVPYPPPEPPAVDATELERGQQLVMQGARSRQIPPCAACHGSHLLGTNPAVPGLLGVSRDYLLGQLGAWRSGARAAYAPDCMAKIAQALTPLELSDVTAWLAAQPVPAGAGPDAGFVGQPPMRCGSFEQATASLQPDGAPQPLQPRGSAGANSALLQRGRALVVLGDCEACHTARGGAAFAGGRAIPTPFGTFYSPNITPDPVNGIGRWSELAFWNALHEGRAPDGSYLYPTFPYTNYTRVTRSDADAMFAYLRSLAPVAQRNQPHALRFPYNHRSLLAAWRLLFFRPGVYQPDPRRSADWNRGAYLVQGLAHCSACHEARNSLGAIRSRTNPAGGLVLSWYAPSLTRPEEAGLQSWSIDQIAQLLGSGTVGLNADSVGDAAAGQGADPHAATLGPMAEVVYSSLQFASSQDLRAIGTYLRSLPASAPRSKAFPQVPDELLTDGATIYRRECSNCHGSNGQGHAPLGPPLAGNRAVTMDSALNPIRVLLFGGYPPGTSSDPQPHGMPPFEQRLDDNQMALVLTYVRASWGNAAAPVYPAESAENRSTPLW